MRRLVIAAWWLLLVGTTWAQGPLPVLRPVDATGLVTYFVADDVPEAGVRQGDRELAMWALKQWERVLNGVVRFEPAAERDAIIRIFWVPPALGRYGEMRAFEAGALRGAAVFIRPNTDALDPSIGLAAQRDPLMRDAVVFLTCLHELGHALGLNHSLAYGDVMYSFGYGGDIPGFFDRYRDRLRTRADIATTSGLTSRDVARARALYKQAS